MSCGCGKIKEPTKDIAKEVVLELAKRYQRDTGCVVVFFKCSDYNFTELKNFTSNGKTEIEYFM